MRKNALTAMLWLISTGVLTAGYAQAPRKPVASINRIRLSPYGTVLSLPGRNGGVTSFQYEGYALTYRFKRAGVATRYETRFLYAFGGQHASSSLLKGRVQGPTATLKTRDGLLQITTTLECDERQPCRLTRSFKNTSRDESVVIEVVQAEAMIDAKSLSENTYRGAYLNDRQGCSDPCPGVPCGGYLPPCGPPGLGAYLPPFFGYAGITGGMPFRVAGLDQTSPREVAILTWLEGVNAKFEVLRFGQSQRMVTVP